MNTKLKLISKLAGMAFGISAALTNINAANAGVEVSVDITTQRMNVRVDGSHYATWKVSTGRRGYTTPTGRYRVQRMTRMHYSRKYHNSPMPHSIFYHGGFAIHATGSISRLGRVASHGCVRLHPANARNLYSLVRSKGSRNTRIRVYRSKRYANTQKRSNSLSWLTSGKVGKKKTSALRKFTRKQNISNNKRRKVYIFGGLDLAN